MAGSLARAAGFIGRGSRVARWSNCHDLYRAAPAPRAAALERGGRGPRCVPPTAWPAATESRDGKAAFDQPPEPGPPRPLTLPPLHETTLTNGLALVVAPRDSLPLVSATLLVRAGPEAEPADRAGLAGMVAELLAKGAVRRGRAVRASDIANQAEALGGTLDTGSGWRASSVGMTVTPPKLDAALALVADAARRPTLLGEELERLRAQSIDGLSVALGQPGAVAGWVARRLYWGAGPYGAVTTVASLKRITRDDVLRFHRSWFRPDRALLVLAGDVSAETATALAQRHFGDWRAEGAPPRREPVAAPAPAERSVLVDMPGAGQSSVIVVAPFGSLAATDRDVLRAGQVASALLGGGYSARLNQEVRVKRGLSYDARSGVEQQPEAGMLSAIAQTNHPTAAQVAELMRGEIERLARDEVRAAELAARTATLIGGFSRRLETNAGVASQVASLWSQGRPLSELATYQPEILAVTPQQVRAYAQRYWQPGRLHSVVVGDLAAAGASLAALDEGALRLSARALDFDRPTLGEPAR